MKHDLLHWRKAFGWTQADLAARVGMTRERISDLERARCGAHESEVRLLAQAFSVEPSRLAIPAARPSGRPAVPARDLVALHRCAPEPIPQPEFSS